MNQTTRDDSSYSLLHSLTDESQLLLSKGEREGALDVICKAVKIALALPATTVTPAGTVTRDEILLSLITARCASLKGKYAEAQAELARIQTVIDSAAGISKQL